jgi:hypothetical protein
VDDEFDETKYYSMDNELPSELLQRVMVTVSKVTRINNPGSPRCSHTDDGCKNPAIVDGVCRTHGPRKAKKMKLCSIDGCTNQLYARGDSKVGGGGGWVANHNHSMCGRTVAIFVYLD